MAQFSSGRNHDGQTFMSSGLVHDARRSPAAAFLAGVSTSSIVRKPTRRRAAVQAPPALYGFFARAAARIFGSVLASPQAAVSLALGGEAAIKKAAPSPLPPQSSPLGRKPAVSGYSGCLP